MGGVVLDASVVVKLLADEPGSAAARRLYTETGDVLVADWTALEVASALWKRFARGQTTAASVMESLDILDRMALRVRPAAELLHEAAALALALHHPVYDCVYLALALSERASVATADARLAVAAESANIQVVRVGAGL